jgi:hypothetical protein
MAQSPAVRQVLYFKNHGGVAGASIVHPHSQVTAAHGTHALEYSKCMVGILKRSRRVLICVFGRNSSEFFLCIMSVCVYMLMISQAYFARSCVRIVCMHVYARATFTYMQKNADLCVLSRR